jgi:hypothetical protein
MVLRSLPEACVTQASSLTRMAGILPAERSLAGWEACADETARMAVLRSGTLSAQHVQQCQCILRRGAFGVVIEVNVHIAVFF